MGPLKDCACTNRKVQITSIAAVVSAAALRDPLPAFAGKALRAIGPESEFKILPRRLHIRENVKQFKGAYCTFAHGSIVLNSLKFVKGKMLKK